MVDTYSPSGATRTRFSIAPMVELFASAQLPTRPDVPSTGKAERRKALSASVVHTAPPNKRMQAARASDIWYGHSMLTGVDKVPLLGRGDAREPDAGRWPASQRHAGIEAKTIPFVSFLYFGRAHIE